MQKGLKKLLNTLAIELARLGSEYLDDVLIRESKAMTLRGADWERVRIFVVFAHAAFEHFLEAVAALYCNVAQSRWDKSNKLSTTLASLLAFYGRNNIADEKALQHDQGKRLSKIISESFDHHRDAISNNNGIRESNLRKLLAPIGLAFSSDPSMFSAMNKLGEWRGEAAHKLGITKVPSANDAKICSDECLKFCEDLILRASTRAL